MNGRSQMQGSKNWILPKAININGSSETLIGWKSGKTTYIPLWTRKEGAWLWTRKERAIPGIPIGFFDPYQYVFGPPGSGSVIINKQKNLEKA